MGEQFGSCGVNKCERYLGADSRTLAWWLRGWLLVPFSARPFVSSGSMVMCVTEGTWLLRGYCYSLACHAECYQDPLLPLLPVSFASRSHLPSSPLLELPTPPQEVFCAHVGAPLRPREPSQPLCLAQSHRRVSARPRANGAPCRL